LYLGKQEGKLVAELKKGKLTIEDAEAPVRLIKKTRKELRSPDAAPVSDISAEELYERLNSEDAPAILVDVRPPQEYNGLGSHIQDTKLIPLGELMNNMGQLAEYKDNEIVTICHSGSRSMMAARLLAQAGFKDIRNLTGGMMMWHRKGYPVAGEVNY